MNKSAIDTGLLGTVMAVQANFYQVLLDRPKNERESIYLLCTRRTRLKKIGQKVMVGDRVIVEEADFVDRRGAIAEVSKRKTQLSRPPVANADLILLVFALAEPNLDPWQLSRFLVEAESTSLDICLCLNKTDLITEQKQQQWQQRLINWGYDPVFISVAQDRGIDSLLKKLKDKIAIVSGPSGVGKSSLINRLIPTVDVRVGEVSGKLLKGRHTTRHVELFGLPSGGLLADSPGFNQPNLECDPQNLVLYFPEARKYLQQGNCQFSDCLHREEPNCIVKKDWERYEYYLKFLSEAIARQEKLDRRPDQESVLKVKIKSSGRRQYEPKLATKKYRRSSRRTKIQDLQQLYDEAEEFPEG
ncbi:MAG: small ribosomal subunit biogenesis GTPase RsgA [Prochloraceae cyanobacterium]|nr:small ribosomal subunit biogenesis GTPase RsgA [Prochloraceae cyanobacterium]